MADVIAFRPSGRAAKAQTPARAPADAPRILLFTGVRYQRDEAPEVSAPQGGQRPGPGSLDGAGGGKRRKRG